MLSIFSYDVLRALFLKFRNCFKQSMHLDIIGDALFYETKNAPIINI